MNSKEIEKIAKKFFIFFDPEVKLTVTEKDGFWIEVESEESGRLIGKMGDTLAAVQYILRMIVAKEANEFIPLTVDVAEYKGKRIKELEELAVLMAENVKNSGYAQEMRPMGANERRIVHTALKDFSGIKTESVGEGELRRVKVEPEEEK